MLLCYTVGMRYRLIIFDLDGTLLNTLTDLHDAVNFALLKSRFPQRTEAETRRFIGNGVRKLVERAVPTGTAGTDTEQVFQNFLARYEQINRNNTAPYPGISELLEALKRQGAVLTVLSNKYDKATKELTRELLPQIDEAFGAAEDCPLKPSPEGAERILARYGFTKAETVLIGDSETDLQTANNAGIDSVAVLWGARDAADLEPFSPKKTVSDTKELLNYLVNSETECNIKDT